MSQIGRLKLDKPLVHAAPDATVWQAAQLMRAHCCGSVAVIRDERLLGVFTESDMVARVVAPGLDPKTTRLEQVMTRDPATIDPTDSVNDAIRTMHECGFQHLPVIDGGRVVAMISWRDLPMDELADMQAELSARQALTEHLR